jgi:hypothetical protein
LNGTGNALTAPAEGRFQYLGPAVNTSDRASSFVETGQVVAGALNWLFTNGGVARRPSFVSQPGLSAVGSTPASLPHVTEWSIGAGRSFGATKLHADFAWRRAGGLREWQVVRTDTPATDALGRQVDRADADTGDFRAWNSSSLAVQVNRRLGIQARVAVRYTLSRVWGTDDTALADDGPLGTMVFAYPEYLDARWAAPTGDLPGDRRHRFALWGDADLLVSESLGVLGVSLLQTFESGRPYAPVSWISVSPFVSNPGYLQPPSAVPYYFTEPDAFRTNGARRTDVATNYTRLIPGTVRGEIVIQFHVLNLFGRRQVLNPESFVRINTSFTDPAGFRSFDPFTQSPEAGIHWGLDSRLSNALESAPMTMRRAYRLSVGLRF